MGRTQDLLSIIRSKPDHLVVRALDELLTRWIPVSERLPDLVNSKDARYVTQERYSGPVLVFDGSEVHVGTYGDVEGWLSGYETLSSVTHWMPLPEPPAD
jgi:hypothetical protein